MKLEIPLPAVIMVHNTENYKGSSRAVVTIDGEQVLFRNGHVQDEEFEAMLIRAAFTRMFLRYLAEYEPRIMDEWSPDTDRDIDSDSYDTTRLRKARPEDQ